MIKVQVVLVAKPGEDGRGSYHYEFRLNGEKFGGGAVCNPAWRLSMEEQVDQCLFSQLRSIGIEKSDIDDIEDVEELEG